MLLHIGGDSGCRLSHHSLAWASSKAPPSVGLEYFLTTLELAVRKTGVRSHLTNAYLAISDANWSAFLHFQRCISLTLSLD